MQNYLMLRETLDWFRVGYDDLRDDGIRRFAELWDATFTRRFTDCREAIKRYTLQTFDALEHVTLLDAKDAGSFRLQTGDLLLIADDDDWYHPDIFSSLRAQNAEQHMAALWPDAVLGYHIRWNSEKDACLEEWLHEVKQRPMADAHAYSAVKTNNYAIGSHLLKQHPQLRVTDLLSHSDAAKSLTAPGIDVLALKNVLSLVNRHPCSYLVLNYGLPEPTQEALVKLVSRYIEGLGKLTLPMELSWARPHAEAMRSLFADVIKSRKS